MNILRRWLLHRGMTPAEFAREAGIKPSTVSRMLREGTKHNASTYIKYSKFFGVSPEEFMRGPEYDGAPVPENEPRRVLPPIPIYDQETGEQVGELSREPIPLLTSIPAGPWMSWLDTYEPGYGEDYVPRYGVKGKHVFAVRVQGDSMEPRLHHGDVLVLDPEKAFSASRSGRIGVVKFNGDYKIRLVHLTPDSNNYLLEPMNKAYETELIPVTGTTIYKIVDVRHDMEEEF